MLENRHVVSVNIYDPGQDARVNLLRVPDRHTYTVEKVYAVTERAISASTANYVEINLENGGADGTAQTVIGGTAGGTPGWVAQTPQELTITAGSGDLTAGQWLVANYAETGTVAPGVITISVELVDGIGSKA